MKNHWSNNNKKEDKGETAATFFLPALGEIATQNEARVDNKRIVKVMVAGFICIFYYYEPVLAYIVIVIILLLIIIDWKLRRNADKENKITTIKYKEL